MRLDDEVGAGSVLWDMLLNGSGFKSIRAENHSKEREAVPVIELSFGDSRGSSSSLVTMKLTRGFTSMSASTT